MQEGACPRREACPYAHNVFEYWLHPTRYRTQLCNDDNRCKRRICFFAHSLEELRVPSCKPFVPPEALAAATPPDALTDAAGNPCDWNQAFGIPKVNVMMELQCFWPPRLSPVPGHLIGVQPVQHCMCCRLTNSCQKAACITYVSPGAELKHTAWAAAG